MASSSVSQESLDINEDYELNARRTRIRTLRARGALHRTGERESETSGDRDGCDMNGDDDEHTPIASAASSGALAGEGIHDSPTRTSAIQRAKDKRTRPNHLQKGKLPKDKRKLREKRRSTGVVHLASTESTGDSLDDDDEEEKLTEAKRNTSYNEVIDADNPETPSEVRSRIQQFQTLNITTTQTKLEPKTSAKLMAPRGFVPRRNKSPSDLEADLEDNQDYDSAVSQSESNFTLTDQSGMRSRGHESAKSHWSSQSKFSSGPVQSFKPNVSPGEQGHKTGISQAFQSNNYAKSHSFDTSERSPSSYTSHAPASPRSPKSPRSLNQNTNFSREPREPMRPVASVLARYQGQEDTGAGSYRSRFRDRELVRGPVGQQFASSYMNKENKEDDLARRKLEKDLERERDENRRLQKVLEDKDKRIAELERQVAMLNRDLEDCMEDMDKLQIENRALIQAVGQLSTPGTHV